MLSFIPLGTRTVAAAGALTYRPGRLMRLHAIWMHIDNTAGVVCNTEIEWVTPGCPTIYSPVVVVPALTLWRILWVADGFPTTPAADITAIMQLPFPEIQENQTLNVRFGADILLTDPTIVEVLDPFPFARKAE